MSFEESVIDTDRGTIIVCNLIETAKAGIIDRAVMTEFLGLWRQVFNILEPNGDPLFLEEVLDAVDVIANPAALKAKYGIESYTDFRFLVPVTAASEPLSTIKLAGFVDTIADPASKSKFAAQGIVFPFTTEPDGAETDALILGDLDPADSGFRIGDAGFGDRLLWVTRTSQLDAGLAGVVKEKLADAARDIVGLVHRKPKDVILSVEVPTASLSGRRMARPTFLDGVNSRFTSVPRDAPPPPEADWGWTFDLRALFVPGLRMAGVPERICDHRPVTGFAGKQSSFKPLGVVEASRGDLVGVKDDLFASHLREPQTRDDLVALLQAMV